MRWGLLLIAGLTMSGLQAQVPEGWFPFVIGELAADSPANVRALNGGPAGAKGPVTWRNGRFYDGGGQRLRFLATNVTFASAFPDKTLAPRIAARMAALGINCVRFHHMDNQYKPGGIWDKAFPDHQHMDVEQLERLDWFIFQLKQQGIYTNLNLHVSRKFNAADGFENADKLPNYDKGVDNFCARMIELQRNYARDLLTHRNPYTQTTYAQEPAVVMVELNNENTLLGAAMSAELRQWPEPYLGELKGYWQDFLKARYRDTAALRKAWDEGSAPLREEMLRNRDFAAGTKEWQLESRHPGPDVLDVADDPVAGKVLHAKLGELGTNPWDFQVHQLSQDFKENGIYTLSFRVRAVPARDVNVAVRWQVADWRNSGLTENVKADGQWREYSFTFRAKDIREKETRLSFNCSNILGDVWFAGLSLKPGGVRGLPAEQTLEAGGIAIPASNSTRQARRDWFEFLMGLEEKYVTGLYKYLKQDLGVKAAVIDTQGSYAGVGGLARESHMDYLDNHAYWQHPSFPGRPWDGTNWTIGNTPMTSARGADTLTGLARQRLAGKAYTISEYNHPAPSDYRAECMPMAAAVGGLQDWDGLFEFDFGSTPENWADARIQGYFSMVADPAKVAFFPVAANLFRRGDMQPAREEVQLQVPRGQVADFMTDKGGSVSELWKLAGVPGLAALQHRLSVAWTDKGDVRARAVQVPETGPVVSDTGELSWDVDADKRGRFLVNTPKTRVILGHVAGEKLQLGDMTVQIGPTANGWAAVAVTSMDNLPLARSQRVLVVAMSRVENQGMGWNERRTSVSNKWGKGPVICEAVPVQVQIGGRALRAWALDGSGQRQGEPCAQGATVNLKAPTVWYEVGN